MVEHKFDSNLANSIVRFKSLEDNIKTLLNPYLFGYIISTITKHDDPSLQLKTTFRNPQPRGRKLAI